MKAWTAAACAHPDFEVGFESISNNAGMAALREAVLGIGQLPTLTTFLPEANGGCIPSTAVRAALAEIDGQRRLDLTGIRGRMFLSVTDI
jgi:hypothetical protein